MIEILKLQNFRRHESLTVNFTNGLNVLRGANEAGKSTLIEAALYALYGAKALRDPLAETVTWGMKESALKVELTIRINGTMYLFSRSKNGAECKCDDGSLVTGQAEVTAHAAELLGADAKTAANLMLASQSGLRGALDDGPAAVSGLMAKLADFDIIDRILDNASQRLLLGSVAPLQAELESFRQRLEALKGSVPHDENLEKADDLLKVYEASLQTCQGLYEQAQTEVARAEHEFQNAVEANKQHARAALRVRNLEQQMQSLDERLAAAERVAQQRPSADEIGKAIADADYEEGYADRVKHYGLFQAALAAYPDLYWEGKQEDMLQEIDKAHEASKAAEIALSEARMRVRELESRLRTSGKCPSCGRSDHNEEEIAAHNQLVRAEIAEAKAVVKGKEEAVAEAAGTVATYKKLTQTIDAYLAKLKPIQHLVLDYSFIPPKPSWGLEVPTSKPDGSAAARLKDLRERDQRSLRAEGERTSIILTISQLRLDLAAARQTLEELKPVSEHDLRIELDKATAALRESGTKVREAQEEIQSLKLRLQDYRARIAAHKQNVENLQNAISDLERRIKDTERNNVLVGKLKKIKPAITDHLWGITLGAVSTFFSQMRGEQSVVTKDKDGFKVNGRSAQSLSGSTLDVLALAIRVALTRTFIPHASFIVLDEPAHGCDSNRTGSVLGFLAGTGFPQTVLASHDDLSESVADNVISLGA